MRRVSKLISWATVGICEGRDSARSTTGQHGRGSAERTGQARPRSPHTQGGDGRGRGRPRRSRGEWVCDTSLCAQNAVVVLACMRWRRRVAGRERHLPGAPCRRNGDQFGTDSAAGSNSGSRPTCHVGRESCRRRSSLRMRLAQCPFEEGKLATLALQAWHARCHHKSRRTGPLDSTVLSPPDGSSPVGVTARVRCNGGRVLMDSHVYACMLVCAVRATAREPCRRTSR